MRNEVVKDKYIRDSLLANGTKLPNVTKWVAMKSVAPLPRIHAKSFKTLPNTPRDLSPKNPINRATHVYGEMYEKFCTQNKEPISLPKLVDRHLGVESLKYKIVSSPIKSPRHYQPPIQGIPMIHRIQSSRNLGRSDSNDLTLGKSRRLFKF